MLRPFVMITPLTELEAKAVRVCLGSREGQVFLAYLQRQVDELSFRTVRTEKPEDTRLYQGAARCMAALHNILKV